MQFRVTSVLSAVLLCAAVASAAVPIEAALCAERLVGGSTLITDAGGSLNSRAKVIEVDSLGRLVWAYVRSDIPWAHSARRLPNGNTLITASNGDRVVEVSPSGNTAWELAEGLSYPNEAYRLPNGNTLITDRNNDRVIEVNPAKDIVWTCSNLHAPHGGNRLANGNTLVCDSDGNRVLEVAPDGSVVWQYANNLLWPRSADRLANGNTLVSDSRHNRVIEVDPTGTVVWSYSSGLNQPLETVRLPNGNTLIANNANVLEVTAAGAVAWQYPPVSTVMVETLWVVNPGSGCSLYVHIHRPVSSGPNSRVPAIVVVPDLNDPGTVFDNGVADVMASEGFAVLHFDADGRGLSRNGTENYAGRVQQDGLHACMLALAAEPYVDPQNLGIYSQGYGVAMAAGMLARHEAPHVKFLLDFEGPADRYQASSSNGGHVPVPPDSESFWQEREAGRFAKLMTSAYLRVQTDLDHTGRMVNNEHAIALIDSATGVSHGGAGMSIWTRVNDSIMNIENRTYTAGDQPNWIPEEEENLLTCRIVLYLHELADRDFTSAVKTDPSPSPRAPGLSLNLYPNPCRGQVTVRFLGSPSIVRRSSLSVFDASGSLVLSQPVASSSFTFPVSSLRAGVYLVRLETGTRTSAAKLVIK